MAKELLLHDYEILGLELFVSGGSKNLALKVKGEDQKVKIINFDKINFLDCSNFSWQNVISEIRIIDISSVSKADLKKEIQSAGIDLSMKAIDFDSVTKGYLVDIKSSVGAQIILICSHILDC